MEDNIISFDTNIFDRGLKAAFKQTIARAQERLYEFITPEQLLYYITYSTDFVSYCKERDIQSAELSLELLKYNSEQDRQPDAETYEPMFSCQLGELLQTVIDNNQKMNEEAGNSDQDEKSWIKVSCADVICAMYDLDDSMAAYLLREYLGKDCNDIRKGMSHSVGSQKSQKTIMMPKVKADAYINGHKVELEGASQEEIFQKLMESTRRLMGSISALSPTLPFDAEKNVKDEPEEKHQREPWEDFVTCINDVYKHKNPLIGREKELERAIRILCRKDKNNPIFLGEPGVGKTAIIYGLAKMIVEGNVPKWLKGQRIYALDMGTVVAGASFHGEFEKRMKMVLEGARRRGNSILYIDEIHTIADTSGGNNSISAAELMKPYLEDGSLRFIGSTTYKEYNKTIAGKKAIARRFAQIDVKEPSVDDTVKIIEALLPIYEQYHGVRYDKDAIRYVVEQTDALISDRFLPDKAIDVLDEAGAYLQQNPSLNKNGAPKAARFQKVDNALISKILTDVCRIDAKALTSGSNDMLKDIDKRMAQEIYGQDEAIRQVVRSVMMSKAGLLEPDKPIASLLFVGPTGVGKTEVCKVLAKELGIELLRFDMSEYTEKHTISKLIGSPAGYVGYDEGGLLTDAIRKTPNCVLLLDEIEKAHTDIYNILLQVMDYAKLTDNKGNKADFKNVILVMTSNAGAQFASQASIGFGGGQTKGEAMLNTVKKTFKPEFINRLSGTVVFNEMDRTMASLILDKKLRQLATRLENKGVTLKLTEEAKTFLLDKGFTTQYGAREMDRVINQYLTPVLMEELLFGKLKKGGIAEVVLENDKLKV